MQVHEAAMRMDSDMRRDFSKQVRPSGVPKRALLMRPQFIRNCIRLNGPEISTLVALAKRLNVLLIGGEWLAQCTPHTS